MAIKRSRRAADSQAQQDMTKVRPEPYWADINDIKPYPYNARDNARAIDAVAKSIQNFGFIVPVVINDEGILAAGHTRVEAAKKLGMAEVLAIKASHLSEDQIDAFRLVDNKVSEIADWNTDLLGPEIARLQEAMGDTIDFTNYGWTQDEIDCLSHIVAADCLSVDTLTTSNEDEETASRISQRRAPTTTRFVLGEFVFFIPTAQYRSWIDGIRRLHNFSEEAITADIKDRLGILE